MQNIFIQLHAAIGIQLLLFIAEKKQIGFGGDQKQAINWAAHRKLVVTCYIHILIGPLVDWLFTRQRTLPPSPQQPPATEETKEKHHDPTKFNDDDDQLKQSASKSIFCGRVVNCE